ncbi:MAG TPA: hypothetical protein VL985_09925, partial [Stellaceae bacterium]|nr:hypothetical protein [Stellaceae bacterium]
MVVAAASRHFYTFAIDSCILSRSEAQEANGKDGKMAQVALRNIIKMFDKTPAVQGIDLDIADREFIVLVGPSGCGK